MTEIVTRTITHFLISMSGVAMAALVGIALGILLTRVRFLAGPVLAIVEILQTIPSLAMLALLMMLIHKLGNTTAIFAIFLYSLLPIVRNTYTAILSVQPMLLEAGRGMGMSNAQLLYKVEVPNAVPVILSGVRVSLITAYGIVTIAVLVGGGGLGQYVYRGTQTNDMGMILTGAIPICLLAVLTDLLLSRLETRLTRHSQTAANA